MGALLEERTVGRNGGASLRAYEHRYLESELLRAHLSYEAQIPAPPTVAPSITLVGAMRVPGGAAKTNVRGVRKTKQTKLYVI